MSVRIEAVAALPDSRPSMACAFIARWSVISTSAPVWTPAGQTGQQAVPPVSPTPSSRSVFLPPQPPKELCRTEQHKAAPQIARRALGTIRGHYPTGPRGSSRLRGRMAQRVSVAIRCRTATSCVDVAQPSGAVSRLEHTLRSRVDPQFAQGQRRAASGRRERHRDAAHATVAEGDGKR